jgi:hypothetical protein
VAVVCEADADLRTASALADRVLTLRLPAGASIADARLWRGETAADRFLPWHHVRTRARAIGLKAHGFFGGEPGAPDAASARLALLLMMRSAEPPDAVLLIRDSDGDDQRTRGLAQARDASSMASRIVVGVSHPKRECWVLAGFEVQSDAERESLERLRRELGFDPTREPEKLTASEPGAKRNAKRVHASLLGGAIDREVSCVHATDLAILRERGKAAGLADFLDEVQHRLAPTVIQSPPAP